MRLLVVEDEVDLASALRVGLQRDGYAVDLAEDLAGAVDRLTVTAYDLVCLDRNLPDGDGLDLLRRWRRQGAPWPVIVLTARDQVSDRVRGLKLGADDYLVKPFDLDELVARIDAVGRRAGLAGAATAGDWRIDTSSRQAWRGGERIELTHRAQNRECLARGAIRAACWLAEQPIGRYGMADVLARPLPDGSGSG